MPNILNRNWKQVSHSGTVSLVLISELLLRFRQSVNWTQADMARQFNVSQQAYWRWETGRGVPPAKHLYTVVELLSVEPNVVYACYDETNRMDQDMRMSVMKPMVDEMKSPVMLPAKVGDLVLRVHRLEEQVKELTEVIGTLTGEATGEVDLPGPHSPEEPSPASTPRRSSRASRKSR